MYIYFSHFEVRVASGDCRVVFFARIRTRGRYSQKNWVGVCGPLPKTLSLFMTKICRIDNLLVHLGYNGTSNSSTVNLQLLKSCKDVNGHEESVSWL